MQVFAVAGLIKESSVPAVGVLVLKHHHAQTEGNNNFILGILLCGFAL